MKMSEINKFNEEQSDIKAIGFANWLLFEGYSPVIHMWYKRFDHKLTEYSTEELYKLYLESL